MTNIDQNAIATLIAKEDIRDLALLYSRGVDRKDIALLRTLYTKDATDRHGKHFSGTADEFIDFLERSLPHAPVTNHCICNHLISVDGDKAEGEVYALACHTLPDGKGGMVEDVMAVRYVDRYRKEGDGRWRFALRDVSFDQQFVLPIPTPKESPMPPEQDLSYKVLSTRLFARGARA
ncbi:MAG: nuclear transport factor 2 family protein [Rhodospirillaceae bacterium]|nr:MAG: nuclear transport factor 2 family protein [Rhodospirillaceae bacterium]